jgi:hypothetical protein
MVCSIETKGDACVDGFYENHLFQWLSKFALKRNADGTDSRADGLNDADWELFQFIAKRNNSEDATEGMTLVKFFHKNRSLWRNYMKQFAVFFMTADEAYWTHSEKAFEVRADEVKALGIACEERVATLRKSNDACKKFCEDNRRKNVIDAPAHSVFMSVNSTGDEFSFALYVPKRDKTDDGMPPLCVASCGDKCVH